MGKAQEKSWKTSWEDASWRCFVLQGQQSCPRQSIKPTLPVLSSATRKKEYRPSRGSPERFQGFRYFPFYFIFSVISLLFLFLRNPNTCRPRPTPWPTLWLNHVLSLLSHCWYTVNKRYPRRSYVQSPKNPCDVASYNRICGESGISLKKRLTHGHNHDMRSVFIWIRYNVNKLSMWVDQ